MLANHGKVFRPIRPGVFIHSLAAQGGGGTVGLIATSDGNDRWLVSCYHVLVRFDMTPGQDDESIFQPSSGSGPEVAKTRMTHAFSDLDIAAARCVAGIKAVNEILGIGPISGPIPPVQGMKVRKSGASTGITDGEIVAVNGDHVQVGLRAGFANDYELSDEGDSGAVWVEEQSKAPVAMLLGLAGVGNPLSRCISVSRVLSKLQLVLA
jgi:hypothetical protein